MRKFIQLVAATLLTLSLALPAFAADPNPAAKAMEKGKGTVAAAKQAAVDINSATEAELKAIPGIGDTYAKKIIAGRPYAKKDQLVSKKVLPKAVYDKVKEKIVAKQAK
ncbi:hypothetical protein GMSM_13900 [Geomonas sp. Red276]